MAGSYAYHDDAAALVKAPPDAVFARLDDQGRFGEHMEKPSLMMAGGAMSYELDEAGGRELGSVIPMRGSMLGLSFFVEEVVTERDPPRHKAWETRGTPRLLVIDHYRMGFDIGARPDYNRPRSSFGRFLSWFFAGMYARRCARRVAEDAARYFRPAPNR